MFHFHWMDVDDVSYVQIQNKGLTTQLHVAARCAGFAVKFLQDQGNILSTQVRSANLKPANSAMFWPAQTLLSHAIHHYKVYVLTIFVYSYEALKLIYFQLFSTFHSTKILLCCVVMRNHTVHKLWWRHFVLTSHKMRTGFNIKLYFIMPETKQKYVFCKI